MKGIIFTKTIMAASFVGVLAYTGIASAHTQPGSLGSGLGKVDYYLVQCAPDPATLTPTGRLYIHVRDLAPLASPVVSILAIKDNVAATSSDFTDGDANYSLAATPLGTDGLWTVLINKTSAAAEDYFAEIHCQSQDGTVHTDTTVTEVLPSN
jgi:hypothetical protein